MSTDSNELYKEIILAAVEWKEQIKQKLLDNSSKNNFYEKINETIDTYIINIYDAIEQNNPSYVQKLIDKFYGMKFLFNEVC